MSQWEGIVWTWKSFDELTTDDIYFIIALRSRVFVVEQNCAFQETDGLDFEATHLVGYHPSYNGIEEWKKQTKLGSGCGGSSCGGSAKVNFWPVVAYVRILPPGLRYEDGYAISRVVTDPDARGAKLGRTLMKMVIERFGSKLLKAGAQTYLLPFYKSFGFQPSSEEYLEDNIPHVNMIRNADS